MTPREPITGDEPPVERRALSIDPEKLAQAVENALAAMEAHTLTEDEITYLRERKLQDERAAWAVKVTKERLPLVFALVSAIGTLLWWLLNHTISIGKAP